MTDEAFHHKFGKIWADRTIPNLSKAEHEMIEDWAWEVFHGPALQSRLARPEGMDLPARRPRPGMVPAGLHGSDDRCDIRTEMQEATNIFRVLIKTLLKAGIITDRTRSNYAAYIDMAELHAEGDRMIGDDIAEEGIKYLMQLNGGTTCDADLAWPRNKRKHWRTRWTRTSPRIRLTTPPIRMISPPCSMWSATDGAPPPSTRSSPRRMIISGTRSTRNISTSTSPGIWKTQYLMPPHMNLELQTRDRRQAGREAEDQARSMTACCSRCRRSCTANRARSRSRPRSATSCAIRARRNTPPTRRAKKPATSRRSPITSARAGASPCRSAPRSAICWSRWWARLTSGRSSSACRCWSKASPWARSRPSTPMPNDPLLKQLCQLVMTDEAFHHKFGKIWADRTIPKLSEEERNKIEDWAAEVFTGLLRNLGSPEQKKIALCPIRHRLGMGAGSLHGSLHRCQIRASGWKIPPPSSACSSRRC